MKFGRIEINFTRPKVGELWYYEDEDSHYDSRYLYFTEIGSPTLEGPGYTYVYFDKKGIVLNDRGLSEPRHVDDTIDSGHLIRIEDPIIIAKFSLMI
jgi:hypothetical protein